MADFVDGVGECPDDLEAAFDAQTFGVAPKAGGRDEQPAGKLKRMRVALNVYSALSFWKTRQPGREAKFIQQHPGVWEIVKTVNKMRREDNGN